MLPWKWWKLHESFHLRLRKKTIVSENGRLWLRPGTGVLWPMSAADIRLLCSDGFSLYRQMTPKTPSARTHLFRDED